ncbi:Thymidylate kinase [Candida viswanathii]|uniref:Thymidylate kinase n=1 Tax=Candida viswanathii TaxID=5486 RepID=A0A367YCK1_9ASCO|nr:Thymidylate kinase [Candida viswanathii]
MPRGQLILIEGLDRSGKSTQASILASKLSPSKLIKFPDRSTPIGKLINEYLTNKSFSLNDQSAHLLFLANRWELNQEIQELLNQGHFVVLDRYIYSGIAYTLAKDGIHDESISLGKNSTQLGDVDWLLGPDKGLPKPDLTLFLTLGLDEISKRKGWGDERYELQQFQAKVKDCFLQILDTKDPSICIVDVGEKTIDQASDQLWGIIESKGKHTLVDEPISYI